MAVDNFLNLPPVTVGPEPTEPPKPPASVSSLSSATTPSPQELQANINQGVQQAAQNLDQIIAAVTGPTNPSGNTKAGYDIATGSNPNK